jgi:Domain of unknown function (DUF4389)
MTEDRNKTDAPESRRPVWVRGFYMLLMLVVWQVAEAVLLGVAIIQFIFALLGGPNERLTAFGGSLAQYLRQVAAFITYATDEMPFPFSDWPAA